MDYTHGPASSQCSLVHPTRKSLVFLCVLQLMSISRRRGQVTCQSLTANKYMGGFKACGGLQSTSTQQDVLERLLALFPLSFVSDTIPCFWLSNEGFSPLPPLLLCYVVPGSTASFEFSSIHPLSSTRSCSQASPDAMVSLPPSPTPGQRSARNSQDLVLLPAECSLDHIIKPAQRELMRGETDNFPAQGS